MLLHKQFEQGLQFKPAGQKIKEQMNSCSEHNNGLKSLADKFSPHYRPTDNTRKNAKKNDIISTKLALLYTSTDQLINKLNELQAQLLQSE